MRETVPLLDYALMRGIAGLSDAHQTVVREMVAALRRAEKEKTGSPDAAQRNPGPPTGGCND